jgi:hypothetical protein
MKTRYYIVDNDGELNLVEAVSQAAARNHVARKRITVRYATQQDLVTLLSSGMTLQQAGASEEGG